MKTMTLDQKEVLCENNSRKVNNKILSVYSWINVQDHILFHSSSLYPCRSLYQSGLANFDIINISKLSVSLRPVWHYCTSKLYKEVLMVIKLCMKEAKVQFHKVILFTYAHSQESEYSKVHIKNGSCFIEHISVLIFLQSQSTSVFSLLNFSINQLLYQLILLK